MTPISEIIFSGFVSTVVNDIIDVSKDKIRRAVRNRSTKHQNKESQIYNVIVNVLNKITYNRYKNNQDSIYDAAEVLLKSFKKNDEDKLKSIKSCLRVLDSTADENECLDFKVSLYEELGKKGYSELFHAILLLQLDQKSRYDNAVYMQLNQKLDEVILILNQKKYDDESINAKQEIKSRTQEYADKWEANMFLNDFDDWDENGVNVKLSDVYKDDYLPRFIKVSDGKVFEFDNLGVLISKYILEHDKNKMLLILGQPGVGKSTLITWIVTKFNKCIDDILVYKFADDLKNVDWQDPNISKRILEALNLSYNDLKGKTLILDGFDEVSIGVDRKEVLDNLFGDLIYKKNVEEFSLIITCRENYVQVPKRIKCKHIILQPWSEIQIKNFCDMFQGITKNIVSENTLKKLIENKEILGIPLILYMVLALNISIEKEGSIVDIYDKIFSLDGGIYDRCIDNKNFEDKHRIGIIKEQIHQISREIAFWMFENNSGEASISQQQYIKICDSIISTQVLENVEITRDFKIGSYFKAIKHCEGIETEELSFIHRSIYEYFVSDYIFALLFQTMEKSNEELARVFGVLLKSNILSEEILVFLKYKIRNSIIFKKFDFIYDTFQLMLYDGMTYYTKECYKNVIRCEMRVFANMLQILHVWKLEEVSFHSLNYYIKHNVFKLDLRGIELSKADLKGAELSGANLEKVNFKDANLIGANLQNANLKRGDLRGVKLQEANLRYADLSGADIRNAKVIDSDLGKAILTDVIIDENQAGYLRKKYDLQGTKVYIFKNKEIIGFNEFYDE